MKTLMLEFIDHAHMPPRRNIKLVKYDREDLTLNAIKEEVAKHAPASWKLERATIVKSRSASIRCEGLHKFIEEKSYE